MNYLYKMLKDIDREKHEKTYGKPMCHMCVKNVIEIEVRNMVE